MSECRTKGVSAIWRGRDKTCLGLADSRSHHLLANVWTVVVGTDVPIGSITAEGTVHRDEIDLPWVTISALVTGHWLPEVLRMLIVLTLSRLGVADQKFNWTVPGLAPLTKIVKT